MALSCFSGNFWYLYPSILILWFIAQPHESSLNLLSHCSISWVIIQSHQLLLNPMSHYSILSSIAQSHQSLFNPLSHCSIPCHCSSNLSLFNSMSLFKIWWNFAHKFLQSCRNYVITKCWGKIWNNIVICIPNIMPAETLIFKSLFC